MSRVLIKRRTVLCTLAGLPTIQRSVLPSVPKPKRLRKGGT